MQALAIGFPGDAKRGEIGFASRGAPICRGEVRFASAGDRLGSPPAASAGFRGEEVRNRGGGRTESDFDGDRHGACIPSPTTEDVTSFTPCEAKEYARPRTQLQGAQHESWKRIHRNDR